MTEQEEFKDELVHHIITKGKRTLTSRNFEDQVMSKIYSERNYNQEICAKLNLSLLFFIIGMVLGISLILSFLVFWNPFFEFAITLPIILLFTLSVISILNIDNYRRLINIYSR